ncbi:hypothetical protein EON65_35690 [archaeon]|nr:MAG: hypothetical protein EON65_35690 [archaeon]
MLAAKRHDYVSVDHSTPGLDEIKKNKEQHINSDSTNSTTDSTDTTETTHKMGTVGCVVMYNGQVAAGTSTGGMTNKLSGRIGDSPLIGAGTYADNKSAAISCTGWGEEFMKHVAAYDVHARMVYGGKDVKTAASGTLFDHLPNDTGGLIAVTAQGDFVMDFNTLGMYRGMVTGDGEGRVGIWRDEEVFSWKK